MINHRQMEKVLNIALVQSSIFWEDPAKNREHFSKLMDTISLDVDLVILPEMFTTGFTMNPKNIDKKEGDKTVQWMQQQANDRNVGLVGSMVYYEDGRYCNRLWFVGPKEIKGYYDKRHTFTLAGEDKVYHRGDKKMIVDFKGFRICPLICYDLRFPVWSRNTENYDVLIYVANWPQSRVNAWDALLKARAIENMAYVLGVNRIGTDHLGHAYSGHSAVYNSLGDTLVFSEKEMVLYATLKKDHLIQTREKLKFLDDRDQFNLKE